MASTIQLRRGLHAASTAEEFSSFQVIPDNYLLKSGEACYEVDTKKLKVGDGVTLYSNLPYIGKNEVLIDGLSIQWNAYSELQLKGFSDASRVIGSVPIIIKNGNKNELSYTTFSVVDLE